MDVLKYIKDLYQDLQGMKLIDDLDVAALEFFLHEEETRPICSVIEPNDNLRSAIQCALEDVGDIAEYPTVWDEGDTGESDHPPRFSHLDFIYSCMGLSPAVDLGKRLEDPCLGDDQTSLLKHLLKLKISDFEPHTRRNKCQEIISDFISSTLRPQWNKTLFPILFQWVL